jgi:hypothetical protein
MRRFVVLLTKELRELVTLQMFLPFVVVIVVFVSIGQVLSDVGASQVESFPCVVADLDGGPYSSVVLTALEQSGFKPEIEREKKHPKTWHLDGASGRILIAKNGSKSHALKKIAIALKSKYRKKGH